MAHDLRFFGRLQTLGLAAGTLLACVGFLACVPPGRRLPAVLPEVSGAAFLDDGSVLLVNDGGHRPVVYALDSVGDDAPAVYRTVDANVDWEALAYDQPRGRVVVCDVGDNRRARDSVRVVAIGTGGTGSDARALAYPDGPHDCEACLLRGDSLRLITKARTLGGDRSRVAYVYAAPLAGQRSLRLVDSFALKRRSVTDAVYLTADTVAVLAYDFRFLGPIPLSRTSVYLGTWGDLRRDRARRIRVRAPFTLTQYEAIAHPRDGSRRLLIASERTPLCPQRFRWVEY